MCAFSFQQAILFAMVLVGVRNEPQGPAYLPPSPRPTGGGGGGGGHPDEWAGVSMYYIFSTKKKRIILMITKLTYFIPRIYIFRLFYYQIFNDTLFILQIFKYVCNTFLIHANRFS